MQIFGIGMFSALAVVGFAVAAILINSAMTQYAAVAGKRKGGR